MSDPTANIFISYRTSDGKDKATALARDLGAAFGDEAVFLDKDDLRGGSPWRSEVGHVLAQRPVLLLLMTPDLLGATDPVGRLRIADPQDPVRREFAAAIGAGAHIIPVHCDGLELPPMATSLPAPLDQIGERTWRQLRAYDWKSDVQRLVQDIQALGVPRCVEPAQATLLVHRRRAIVGALATTALAAGAAWSVWQRRRASPEGVSGSWDVTGLTHAPTTFVFLHTGGKVEFKSLRVPIASSPDWAEYRRSWRDITGTDLDAIAYRGAGTVRADPGEPLVLDLAIQIVSAPGDGPIDSGNLNLRFEPGAARMSGKLWLNSAQADRAVELKRRGPGQR